MTDDSEDSSEVSTTEYDGVILGVWDQEKTPTLIQDLERSVSSIEGKCKRLFRYLSYYRKFLEEWSNPKSENFWLLPKENPSNNRKQQLLWGSDPDLNFRKYLIKLQESEDYFKSNIESELFAVNQELAQASDKIGLTDNIFLFSTENYVKSLNENPSLDDYEEFVKLTYVKPPAKSESTIPEISNLEVAKISKNELELYQKLSRLSLKRKKSRKKLKRLNAKAKKWAVSRRKMKREDVGSEHKLKPVEKRKRKKFITFNKISVKKFKNSKFKVTINNYGQNEASKSSRSQISTTVSKTIFGDALANESEVDAICNALTEAIDKHNCEKAVESTVLPSVSKETFLNVSKNQTKKLNNQSQFYENNQKLKLQRTSASINIMPNREFDKAKKNPREKSHDSLRNIAATGQWNQTKTEFPEANDEKLWSGTHLTDFKKCRSKYTKSSDEKFVEYHKSTQKQYTNGKESMYTSQSERAYAVGSKIMVSDCRRTDIFQINKNSCIEPASGDSSCAQHDCSKLKEEWNKVYKALTNLYRRYTVLKNEIPNKSSDSSEADFLLLSKEIDDAIDKYSQFLQFYCKFLELRHRLKSMKDEFSETMTVAPVTSFAFNCQSVNYYKTKNLTVLKKAFRNIQDLQEKIKLISDF